MKAKLVLAEKPAVARDLARVLGVPVRGGDSGAYHGEEYVVTWCIGHLIELEEPAAYRPEWRRWAFDSLPMLPEAFQLRPSSGTTRQWRVVRELLRRRDFSAVINACDAGREGELIFQFCYELSGCRLPVQRLWISSLTDQAIRQGFAALRPGEALADLHAAARCRAEADWLVGMNGTRAITLQRRASQDVLCSIGRVQTPTLGILVRRERQIREFVPRDYFEVIGEFSAADPPAPFRALWHLGKARRLAARPLADDIAGRSAAHDPAVVESVEQRAQTEPPPLLFDLTALQRTANRRFGLSAHRTLQIAQRLYEEHKLITYPRTDSRYLTSDLHPQLGRVFGALQAQGAYAPLVAPLLAAPPPPLKRVFQDHKARDHHAIIPTAAAPRSLSGEEQALYDLIVRRFIGAFYPDARFLQTEVILRAGPPREVPLPKGLEEETFIDQLPPPPDRYRARGRVRTEIGWQAVAGYGEPERGEEEQQALPPLQKGQTLPGRYRVEAKRTQPPPRYSEATLLGAMETAGKDLSDPELRQEMKERGLGTPATRAAIIETLLARRYIERQGKVLCPTALGVDLVERLPVPDLASAELTGRWEARLSRIARGEDTRAAFMADIRAYVAHVVAVVQAAPVPAAVALSPGQAPPEARSPRPRGKRGTKTPQKTATGAPKRPTRAKRAPAARAPAARAPTARTPRAPRAAAAAPAPRPLTPAPRAAVGQPLCPPVPCPRCHSGQLLTGHHGWGCARFRQGCPLVIPYVYLGHRLREEELRGLCTTGSTGPLRLRLGEALLPSARLRLSTLGGPSGFLYVDEGGAPVASPPRKE